MADRLRGESARRAAGFLEASEVHRWGRSGSLVCCCGRDQENDQFVNSSSYIQVLKTYDAMGRPYTTSTPAVPGSGFSQSWLTTYYP